MKKILKVVGIAFVENGKLLIVQSHKSKKTNSFTFIGGGVEDGETLQEAAIREIKEEIGSYLTITEENLEPFLCFEEQAASDPNLTIEMNIFLAHKEINVPLIPNEEILEFHWYKLGETTRNLSASIKDHFIPHAIEKQIMY